MKLNRRFSQRLIILIASMALLTLILIGRLFFLQVIRHENYTNQSQSNLLNIIPSAPSRGLITDRNKYFLAKNIPTYTLSLMSAGKDLLHDKITAIRHFIPISDKEELRFFRMLPHYRLYQPIPLKTHLTNVQLARYYVNRYRLSGTYIQSQMMRTYPEGDVTGPLIGYVGRINNHEANQINMNNYGAQPVIGKAGVEKQYEQLLHGESGHNELEINAKGEITQTLAKTPAKDGSTLTLTLDIKLQRLAQRILGKDTGAIVMLDPNNGDILAMASRPTYDNNLFSGGISHNDYQHLLNADGHPLFNRILQGQFAPGSTIKPFIALAALDKNIITTNTTVYDPGWFRIKGTKHIYHDWHLTGHGWVNVVKAIKLSCDVFFYHLVQLMGIHKLDDALNPFGFGQPTGVDLPREHAGLLPSPSWKKQTHGQIWFTGDTIETGIGQGFFLVTPLQLASAIASIATHGKRVVPHVLKSHTTPDGSIHLFEPKQLSPVILKHAWVWDTVIKAMQQVVEPKLHGTGHYFGSHRGFTVAGKTGTAQVYGHTRDEDRTRRNIPKHLRNNHWFVAFAPVKHPKVAVVVVIEHNAWADKKAGQLLRAYFAEHSHHEATS